MAEKHVVRFEPVGIEIEVNEDQTILRGAAEQGIMLMHGCKEGQCAACKSFLLDGEVDLERYSTFALNAFEKEEGWTLLCRAHAESDLQVELINYDEEILRSGVPEQTEELKAEWERRAIPVPLKILDSPYREVSRPIIKYIKEINRSSPRDVVSIFIPEYVVGRWWEQLLHNQHALRLKGRLLFMRGVMVTSVPYQLASSGRVVERARPVAGDVRRALDIKPLPPAPK